VALPVQPGEPPLDALVLEDLGVGGLDLLHRVALDGEAVLQGLPLPADLQLVELLEVLLGHLEPRLGGGVRALERGVRLQATPVELAGRGLPGLSSVLGASRLRVRIAELLLRLDGQLGLVGLATEAADELVERLDLVL